MVTSPPRRRAVLPAAFLVVAAALASANAAQPVYFPDDPIAIDPETQDAGNVREWALSDPYDFVENTFFKPGDRTPRRALNINTIDEVPDSSWFTNRAGVKPLTAEEVRRGPDTTSGPAPGKWTVVSGKSDGVTPGFTILDSANVMWFIKFDPESNPEMATGAEMVATKLFWALGFHVPENHLAVLRHAQRRWPDAAELSRAVIGQRLGSMARLSRQSQLILADSLLELGDVQGAHAAIAELYNDRLSLPEALSLLSVQLDYLSRINAWERMLEGIPTKVQLAELMPTGASAKAQALLALAAAKLGRTDLADYLRRRVELLVDVDELIRSRPALHELYRVAPTDPAPKAAAADVPGNTTETAKPDATNPPESSIHL